jgi:peptide/nickel transport system permease protein
MSRSKTLLSYIGIRLLLAPLMLWTIVTLVFLLMRATPGDPMDAILGNRAPAEVKEELRVKYGLHLPLPVQYFNYLWGIISRLDLGKSISKSGDAVTKIIGEYFPATLELAIGSLIVAFGIGAAIGIFAASKAGTKVESIGRWFSIISYALPVFWVGMLLQLLLGVAIPIFPLGNRFPSGLTPPDRLTGMYTIDCLLRLNIPGFFAALHHLFLPCFTLGILLSGIFERIVRVNLKENLRADYVEAARARGIPERRILLVHALKNALIPVITILGLTTASLLGGAVLTETAFSWPGLASRLYDAISNRDYPVVQGIMVFFATIVVFASIIIDIVNAWVDPRIKY